MRASRSRSVSGSRVIPAVSNERGIGNAPVATTGLSSSIVDNVDAEDSALLSFATEPCLGATRSVNKSLLRRTQRFLRIAKALASLGTIELDAFEHEGELRPIDLDVGRLSIWAAHEVECAGLEPFLNDA